MRATVALLLCLPTWALAQTTLVFQGEVASDGPDFVRVPFEVPAGLAELEVRHLVPDTSNILDFGVDSPLGFRGYGGGNTEAAVIGVQASSRSYLAGELTPGTWSVVIGKAKVPGAPAQYRIEVELRPAATLPAQPERTPYAPGEPLSGEARWYAGDLHVHSRESGDAQPSLDAIATFARGRGLDFVELSDHNTRSQLDFYRDVQARHPELLLLPGVEFTTYQGHANGIGATEWVDHRFGLDGETMASAAQKLVAQGAVLSINHPVLDLGSACIGCAWKHPIPKEQLGAVEIQTGGWDKTGVLFGKQAFAFWERLLAQGLHVAPVGGSDDHRAGQGTSSLDSPIGAPTTLVWARELSIPALLQGFKDGRTVVKLQGPQDPMVELTSGAAGIGDTVRAAEATFRARVTGGAGARLRFVVDGVADAEPVAVDADPFEATRALSAPEQGETRIRAEVLVGSDPRTVTGHLWLAQPPAGCGCGAGAAGSLGALGVALLALRRGRGPRARCRVQISH